MSQWNRSHGITERGRTLEEIQDGGAQWNGPKDEPDTRYYTQEQVDELVSDAREEAEEYATEDMYTSEQVDEMIAEQMPDALDTAKAEMEWDSWVERESEGLAQRLHVEAHGVNEGQAAEAARRMSDDTEARRTLRENTCRELVDKAARQAFGLDPDSEAVYASEPYDSAMSEAYSAWHTFYGAVSEQDVRQRVWAAVVEVFMRYYPEE